MTELALSIGGTPIPAPSGIPTGGLFSTGQDLFKALAGLLFIIAIVLGLIFLILGGIRWIVSGGDPKGVEAARKQLTYAVIGLVIVFLAFFIVNLIAGFFGVTLLGS